MNNLTLAGERRGGGEWTYYETIGGGQGACPDADGPSAIHVAMSNTLNTPVEALETELPAARARALGAPGQRRRRAPPRRRRDRARDRGAGADALHADRRAPRGARRAGATGASRASPGRDTLNGEPIPGKAEGELAPGRPPADRDPRRRRPRRSRTIGPRAAIARLADQPELEPHGNGVFEA